RDGHAEAGNGEVPRELKEVPKLVGAHEQGHVNRIDPAGLKCTVVHVRRYRLTDGVSDDRENLRRLREFVDAIEGAKLARIDLTGGRSLNMGGSGISINGSQAGREYARGKSELSPGKRNEP